MTTRFQLSLVHPLAATVGALLAAAELAAVTPRELAARMARNEPMLIIDVRAAVAYGNGHVPGAMNIPLGLLPVKPLPSYLPVFVYGDGLGVVDDTRALAVLRSKPGVRAELLEGGYAAWLSETRLTTVPAGVERERLPGITYDQLVAANKGDMVLVDLRGSASAPPAVPPATAAAEPRRERLATMSPGPDLVAQLAAKLGVPLLSAAGGVSSLAARAQAVYSDGTGSAAGPARAAAPGISETGSSRLLVLVADNDTDASEAARQLRASGQYRFTILIGGTDSIRHEGRVGSARMDADVKPTKSPATR